MVVECAREMSTGNRGQGQYRELSEWIVSIRGTQRKKSIIVNLNGAFYFFTDCEWMDNWMNEQNKKRKIIQAKNGNGGNKRK